MTWPLAVVATGLGVLGLVLALLALTAKRREDTWASGLVVLALASAAAGVGFFATWYARHGALPAEFADRLVDLEYTRAWRLERARVTTMISVVVALVTMGLGGLVTVRAARAAPRDVRDLRLMMGLGFLALTGLLTAGTLGALKRRPVAHFDFAVNDEAAWGLARALDGVQRQEPGSCFELNRALKPFVDASAFPRRVLRPMPTSLQGWRAAGDACVEKVRAVLLDPGTRPAPELGLARTVPPLLFPLVDSPMVADPALIPPPWPALPGESDGEGLERLDVRMGLLVARVRARTCLEGKTGRVTVRFVVDARGRVVSASDLSPSPGEASACFVAQVRALEFEAARDGNGVTVTYRLAL